MANGSATLVGAMHLCARAAHAGKSNAAWHSSHQPCKRAGGVAEPQIGKLAGHAWPKRGADWRCAVHLAERVSRCPGSDPGSARQSTAHKQHGGDPGGPVVIGSSALAPRALVMWRGHVHPTFQHHPAAGRRTRGARDTRFELTCVTARSRAAKASVWCCRLQLWQQQRPVHATNSAVQWQITCCTIATGAACVGKAHGWCIFQICDSYGSWCSCTVRGGMACRATAILSLDHYDRCRQLSCTLLVWFMAEQPTLSILLAALEGLNPHCGPAARRRIKSSGCVRILVLLNFLSLAASHDMNRSERQSQSGSMLQGAPHEIDSGFYLQAADTK
mmetsp:Transcript_2281/g.6031  ORF Transcript_2281/g.6031 Transcript_2281/m.6031 type:complete len:332 (-) Transcript_2281:68-1063(-)